MSKGKPTILVTNDDGIIAPGLKILVEAVKEFGNVVVVAPHNPQSGVGHAVTVNTHIRLNKTNIFDGIPNFSCSGTPVDSVKMGINIVLNNKVPDLIVSGVNHGSNVSTNILYSGTMSAAVEGALEGIPSIGFSYTDYSWDADMSICTDVIKKVVKKTLEEGIPENVCLNVNIPNINKEELKGIKVCRQAKALWEDRFENRQDPLGKDYYWLTGKFTSHDKGHDADVVALEEKYVSVVPIQFDMTAYHAISKLNEWEF